MFAADGSDMGRYGQRNDGGEFLFCFFKQKSAYEMLRSLVGSEMCIRDRVISAAPDYEGPPGHELTRLWCFGNLIWMDPVNILRTITLTPSTGKRCSQESCFLDSAFRDILFTLFYNPVSYTHLTLPTIYSV